MKNYPKKDYSAKDRKTNQKISESNNYSRSQNPSNEKNYKTSKNSFTKNSAVSAAKV